MNDCFHRLINSVILQSYWNFPNGLFNYIKDCIFSRLKLLFNFYVKRTVHRQDFGAKFNVTYRNGAPVEDILKANSFYKSLLQKSDYLYDGARIMDYTVLGSSRHNDFISFFQNSEITHRYSELAP